MESTGTTRPLTLVVEDNQDLQTLYELILSDAGYRVAGASDGRSGLDLARRLRPAVVVLDMMMPDMGGLEFLDRLPSCGQPVPPVVVSSGFQDFEPHARARGAYAFLRKPVMAEELVATIERALAGQEEGNVERAQAARVAAGREHARREREQFLARIDVDDAELRAMLEGVLAWLSRYYGFGTGLVDLLHGDKIYVEAGGPAPLSIQRDLTFCSDVVDAGSSLVIPDVTAHPVFAEHKAARAAAYWGARFYAGCPITTSGGCVVGTVCLIDHVPRRFGVGDMRVLEYLARRIGDHFEALAEGQRPAPFFEPPALFERAAIRVVLGAQLAAAARADLVLVTFARAGAEPALLRRAAEAIQETVSATRSAAARWTADTLAFVIDGAHRPDATERALTDLREAGLPPAAGVAQVRPGADRSASVDEMIAAAEAACAQSVAAGGTLVRTVVPARDRRVA